MHDLIGQKPMVYYTSKPIKTGPAVKLTNAINDDEGCKFCSVFSTKHNCIQFDVQSSTVYFCIKQTIYYTFSLSVHSHCVQKLQKFTTCIIFPLRFLTTVQPCPMANLSNRVTLLLRLLFLAVWQNSHTFSFKKTLVGHPLIWPIFFCSIHVGDHINGVPL